MEFTGERVVPWAKDMRNWVSVMHDHLERYVWAMKHVAGKLVRDFGTGAGYGAFLMSFLAEKVYGYDLAEPIAFAKGAFKAANLKFIEKDLTTYRIPKGTYRHYRVLQYKHGVHYPN